MPRREALAKLAKASALSLEAARLYAEVTAELALGDDAPEPPPAPPPAPRPLNDMEKARARRALTRVGARTR